MDQLKTALAGNRWIIDIQLHLIRQKMAERLNYPASEKTSTTFLASSIYKPSGIDSAISPSKCKPLEILSDNSFCAEYLRLQILHLFNSGSLVKNETLILTAENWIKEFIITCTSNPNYVLLPKFLEYAILLENVNFRGASHPHFLGSLFLHLRTDDTKFDFFTSIIHESAHHELFLINFVDRLVNKNSDYNLIHAPYQNKARPPIGRLHSLHALFRMIQFNLDIAIESSKLTFFISKFKSNLISFEKGELTELGNYLLEEVYGPFSKSL